MAASFPQMGGTALAAIRPLKRKPHNPGVPVEGALCEEAPNRGGTAARGMHARPFVSNDAEDGRFFVLRNEGGRTMFIKLAMLVVFFAVMVGVGLYCSPPPRRTSTAVRERGGRSVGPSLTAFAYGTCTSRR